MIGQYLVGGPAPHLGTHAATTRLVVTTTLTNTVLITVFYEIENKARALLRTGIDRGAGALE